MPDEVKEGERQPGRAYGRLAGKVAFVAGAGTIAPGIGNGKAAALLFAREGATVFALDANEDAAQETSDLIASEGGTALAFAADVSASEAVRAAVAACVEAFGRIDILHNNVGLTGLGSPETTEEALWQKVISVNLTGMYLTCRHVLPVMVAQGAGAIVNVSSIASTHSLGYACVSYSASKGGVNALTRDIALNYAANGIRCNAILPGLMNTPLIHATITGVYGDAEEMVRRRSAQCPMGFMGDGWDVAYAAAFLASDEARYITGIELVVDGGVTLKTG